jgi:hypothetical protein
MNKCLHGEEEKKNSSVLLLFIRPMEMVRGQGMKLMAITKEE